MFGSESGSVVLAFEQGAPPSRDRLMEPRTWCATYVDKFLPYEDMAQLAMRIWRDGENTQPTSDFAMTSTWDRFPDLPAVAVDEPLITLVSQSMVQIVKEAFRDYRKIRWVVTVDSDAMVRLWERSDHPVHSEDGIRKVVHFHFPPQDPGKIGIWLDAMSPPSRVLSHMVLAMMRDEQLRKGKQQIDVLAVEFGKEENNG